MAIARESGGSLVEYGTPEYYTTFGGGRITNAFTGNYDPYPAGRVSGTTYSTKNANLINTLPVYGDSGTGTSQNIGSGIYVDQAQPRIGSTTTSSISIKPTVAMPSLALPDLALPAYDESKITGRTQKIASPIIRAQRQLAQRALARHYDNPNVAKLVSGEILRQFGTNLAESLAGARRTASTEYTQQLELERQKIAQEYAVKQQEALTNYQAALQDYMQQYGQKTTTTYDYTYGTGTEKAIPTTRITSSIGMGGA